jgi:hypothetical protein
MKKAIISLFFLLISCSSTNQFVQNESAIIGTWSVKDPGTDNKNAVVFNKITVKICDECIDVQYKLNTDRKPWRVYIYSPQYQKYVLFMSLKTRGADTLEYILTEDIEFFNEKPWIESNINIMTRIEEKEK